MSADVSWTSSRTKAATEGSGSSLGTTFSSAERAAGVLSPVWGSSTPPILTQPTPSPDRKRLKVWTLESPAPRPVLEAARTFYRPFCELVRRGFDEFVECVSESVFDTNCWTCIRIMTVDFYSLYLLASMQWFCPMFFFLLLYCYSLFCNVMFSC